jgi:hypothetical protein
MLRSARSEEESMRGIASLTTSDAAIRRIAARPFGLRRDPASAALRLLDDAILCIDCVAAPCIQPGRAGNAAHAAYWDRLY